MQMKNLSLNMKKKIISLGGKEKKTSSDDIIITKYP